MPHLCLSLGTFIRFFLSFDVVEGKSDKFRLVTMLPLSLRRLTLSSTSDRPFTCFKGTHFPVDIVALLLRIRAPVSSMISPIFRALDSFDVSPTLQAAITHAHYCQTSYCHREQEEIGIAKRDMSITV